MQHLLASLVRQNWNDGQNGIEILHQSDLQTAETDVFNDLVEKIVNVELNLHVMLGLLFLVIEAIFQYNFVERYFPFFFDCVFKLSDEIGLSEYFLKVNVDIIVLRIQHMQPNEVILVYIAQRANQPKKLMLIVIVVIIRSQ